MGRGLERERGEKKNEVKRKPRNLTRKPFLVQGIRNETLRNSGTFRERGGDQAPADGARKQTKGWNQEQLKHLSIPPPPLHRLRLPERENGRRGGEGKGRGKRRGGREEEGGTHHGVFSEAVFCGGEGVGPLSRARGNGRGEKGLRVPVFCMKFYSRMNLSRPQFPNSSGPFPTTSSPFFPFFLRNKPMTDATFNTYAPPP